MSLVEVIHNRPDPAAYTSLLDHQSTTPVSFFNSAPVLHFRCETCQVITSAELLAAEGPFRAVFGAPLSGTVGPLDEICTDKIDCFVGTNAFILYNPILQKSLSIPYPSITLHALKQEPLLSSPNTKLFKIYLQLSFNSANEESLEELLELAIVPLLGGAHTAIRTHSNEDEMMDIEVEPQSGSTQITQEVLAKALFAALSKCSNLHPTQTSNTIFSTNGAYSDEDGGDYDYKHADLPEGAIPFGSFQPGNGFPGEGGWITAENVDQFQLHANGGSNGASLGPGAGSVRPREEDPDTADAAANGGSDAKWRRTE